MSAHCNPTYLDVTWSITADWKVKQRKSSRSRSSWTTGIGQIQSLSYTTTFKRTRKAAKEVVALVHTDKPAVEDPPFGLCMANFAVSAMPRTMRAGYADKTEAQLASTL